jgi:IS5 family transposase
MVEIKSVFPAAAFLAVIDLGCLMCGYRGGPPIQLATMSRIKCMQKWHAQSADAALYDIESVCHFAGHGPNKDAIPDEMVILRFRHLFESHGLSAQTMNIIIHSIERRGQHQNDSTMVDATIIHAPPPTN